MNELVFLIIYGAILIFTLIFMIAALIISGGINEEDKK